MVAFSPGEKEHVFHPEAVDSLYMKTQYLDLIIYRAMHFCLEESRKNENPNDIILFCTAIFEENSVMSIFRFYYERMSIRSIRENFVQ